MKHIITHLVIITLSLFINQDLLASCSCSGNLVTNPSFESGTTGWSKSGGNLNAGTGAVKCGSKSGDFQITNTSNNWATQTLSGSFIAGTQLQCKVYAGTHNNSYDHFVGFQYFDDNWNYKGSNKVHVNKVLSASPTGPQLYTVNGTVPTGATKVQVVFHGTGSWIKTDGWCVTVTSTPNCDPNSTSASSGFCAPAPNCSGSNKWTWSQSINQSTGAPSSFRLGNWSGGVLYKDITSGLPSAASGPITVSVTDAVAWDGYASRASTGNQTNERFRLKFYKGSSVVYTTPFTTDGISTGVKQDYWRGALGGSVFLANGFDKVRIEHYNVAYPSASSAGSVVPTSFCVSYSTPPCDPNSTSAAAGFCAPDPICTGSDKFSWSQTINRSTGAPSVVRLINSSKLTHTITSGIPTAAKTGPMTIQITDAVSWDGYSSRNNVTQTNERWRLKVYKGTSLVYTSPYTTDVQDQVKQAYWRGALGTAATISNGFDKVVIEHIGGSGAGSVVPASFCIKYTPCGNITTPGSIATNYTYCNSGNPPAFTSVNPASGGCGGTIQYQWQKRVGTSGTFVNISGATAATYNQGTTTETTQFRRRAKRSTSSSYLYSNVLTITVNKQLTTAGTIAASQTFCNSGNPANITSTAPASGGSGGSITYQWYSYVVGVGPWTAISGATAATYNPPTISASTHYRRGAKRSVCGNLIYTPYVTMTINKELTTAGAIGSPQTFCNSGDPATFTNTTSASGGSGGSVTYIWQKSTNNSTWSTISGATSSTYNAPTITATTYYRRGAKRSVCGSYKYTSSVKVTVNKELTTAGAIGSPQTFCGPGNPAAFTNTTSASGGSGGTVTYQWQKSANNSSWSNISGATSSTYNAPSISATTYYRRAAKRSVCGNYKYTSSVKVTINHDLDSAGAIGSPQTFCNSGNPVAFTNIATPSGGTGGTIQYVWQSSTNNSSWTTISGATNSTYDAPTVTSTTYYRRGAKRSVCGVYIYSSSVKVTVNKKITAGGTVGSNQSFCNSGNPALFTNTTSASGGVGGSIIYQWQSRVGTSGTYVNISGATSATYNAPTVSATTQYRRRARRTSCTGYEYSNTITVTVQPGVDAGADGSTTVCDHSTTTINLASLITGEDAGGVWTRTQGAGGTFNASAGTYKPAVGATTSKFKYTMTGTSPCPNDISYATVNINVCQIMVSGKVFNDVDGLTDNNVDGVGIGSPSSTPLYANLVNSSNKVVASVAINSNGTYQFPNVTTNTVYTMVLSTVQGTVGNNSPTPNVPNGWMNTGESPNNSTSDGTVDGKQIVTVGTVNVPNIDFGVQRPPTPSTNTQPVQPNPGGNVFVNVPNNAFSGSDFDGGIVTALRITNFPLNTESIKINGVTYTSSNWPAAGVTLPTSATGVPTQAVQINPINGAITSTILYKTIDNAGAESPATGYVKLPFNLISLSGNVFEDNNGPTNVDGTGISNPSSTQLYANLVDPSGNVEQTVAVGPTGAYNFNSVTPNTNYTMVLSTTQGTVGNPAPTSTLPFGWENVSEDCCNNLGNDGNTNGVVSVPVTNSDKTNVNFGITQPLTIGNRVFTDLNQDGNRDSGEPYISGATVKLYKDDDNNGTPDGAALQTTTTNTNGIYRFDDLTPGNYIVGVTPPAPASGPAYINTDGAAQSSNPNNDINDDDNGIVTVGGETRSGTIIMAAGTEPTNDDTYSGIPDANSNMSIDFGFFQPLKLSGIVFNDESGPTNVDGSPIGSASGNQLYANLIDASGNVEAITPIDQFGMYEFLDLEPNTAYSVVLTDMPGTVNNPAPAPSLPVGWKTVAEDCCDGIGNDGTPDGINISPTGTEDVPNVNFGIREPVAIGNLVWNDANKNGVLDGSESPLANAIVNLYEDNNNDGNPDGASIGTITTQADGLYKFDDLYSGKYIVGVTPPSLASGTYESSVVGQETNPNLDVDNNDNGINKVGNEVRSNTVNLVSNTEPLGETPNNAAPVPDSNANLTIDFGFYPCPASFTFTPVDLCLNNTFDLTSAEPTAFTGGAWTQSNVPVANPTAVGPGTYTYTYNDGNCSASGSLMINSNVPDYTPTIQIAPSAITGTSNVRVILTLSEILNKNACSDLYILVPKLLPRFQFVFDNNATSIGGIAVDNADWQYFENANPNFYIWKYTANSTLFPSGGSSKIGYIGAYDPNNTDGQSTFSVQVFQGSGGETNQTNNTDSDLLIYFR